MTKLSVNINKVATLRNARGGNVPNLLQVTKDLISFGAEGITVHPRPDERHIRYQDVYDLKEMLTVEFNIEGNPNERFIELVEEVCPTQVTLVPDAPDALTSNAGWLVEKNFDFLCSIVKRFHRSGIRVSIFVGTDLENIRWAAKTGADRIELYTEPYASDYPKDKAQAVADFVKAGRLAKELGLEVNAGHDLSLENLAYLIEQMPFIAEVSIGHALISDALYLGLEETVKRYKACLH